MFGKRINIKKLLNKSLNTIMSSKLFKREDFYLTMQEILQCQVKIFTLESLYAEVTLYVISIFKIYKLWLYIHFTFPSNKGEITMLTYVTLGSLGHLLI